MNRSFKLVQVRWYDSDAHVGWEAADSFIQPMELATSVGYLIEEDFEMIVLAADYDAENHNLNRVMRIPRQCIVSMEILTIAEFP